MSIELSETAQGALVDEGLTLVLGGPGSGKTTLSLLKAQALIPTLKPGQEVLFLSFSRAAVRQVEVRCKDILSAEERKLIAVRTYHAFSMDILRAHGRLLVGRPPKIIYPGEEAIAEAAYAGDWRAEASRLASEEGRYVFGEFASGAATLLAGSIAVASLIANKYPIVILDEFQDTNEAQWQLVQRLAQRSRLVVLADPDQRIFDYDPTVDPERLDQLRALLAPTEYDLTGENHRSPDAGIMQFANSVLTNRELPDTSDVKTIVYRGHAFDATVHASVIWMFSELRKLGVTHPSVVVLARANPLVGRISSILSVEHTYNGKTLRPVEHDVLWDAELTAAAAIVIASILEWPQRERTPALVGTFERLADYFDAKNANRASKSARDMSARYRKAAQNVAQGRSQRPASVKLIERSFDQGIVLRGDPSRDWLMARELLASGSDFADLLANVNHVRLFRASDEIGSRLANAWDRKGGYGSAADLVKRALDAGKIQSDQRAPRGSILMTMHKAKGKEFDGAILIEGQYQGLFFNPDREQEPFHATRRLLRVALTRARRRVLIVRPHGALPLTDS